MNIKSVTWSQSSCALDQYDEATIAEIQNPLPAKRNSSIAMRFRRFERGHSLATIVQWALTVLVGLCICSSAASFERPNNIAVRMKPLASDNVKRCGLTLRYPALENWHNDEIALGCVGSYKDDHGTSLGIDYSRYPSDPERIGRYISMNIYPMGIDDWLATDSGHDTAFEQAGKDVHLLPKYSFGNECHNLLRTVITPISGANWRGWIAEEVYGKAKNPGNNSNCKIYAPKNRCVHLLIGNEKMSAELAGSCLLKKTTTNLEEGISYSLFLQMINSIHFNEE